MSTEQQDANSETLPAIDHNEPDWYLQALVSLVNGKAIEFPITIFVSGVMVSGQLVSGHRYFEEGLRNQLTQFFGGEEKAEPEVLKYFTDAADIYLQDAKESEDSQQPPPPPVYLHLREARVFAPGQQPVPAGGSWWRGRLTKVDAFHFGSLGVAPS